MEDPGMEPPPESRPLKAEEPPAEQKAVGRTPGRLSRWRTGAFFLALFLCLAAVLAFSFAVPCPVRPASQRSWNRSYVGAAAYQFLATGDVDRDPVQDVLFAFQASSEGGGGDDVSLSGSCAGEGFLSPCAFLVALSGTDGKTLWQRPVAEELLLVNCFTECDPSRCFVVGRPDSIIAFDLHTGKRLWKQRTEFGADAVVLQPLLQVPDVDGDKVPDVLLFTNLGQEIRTWFFSGKQGTQLGSPRGLSLPRWVGHLMQVTKMGAHYVLICTASALYGYSVKELYDKAVGRASNEDLSLTEDPHWALAIDSITHSVPLLSTGEIEYLEKMPGKSGTNILVVRSAALEVLDGRHLGSVWTSRIPHMLRAPEFGSFHSDTVGVVIERNVTADRKKVLIFEGSSGAVDWETELPWMAGNPQAASLATVDHKSIFLFWGTQQVDTNTTEPDQSQPQHHRLYLFHPSLPNVLLETSSIWEPIVAFEAMLLERSRHASYLLLMGPRVGELPGQVALSKRKVKDDMAHAHVIWLNQVVQDSVQNIRDRFLRMRYRSLG